MPFSSALISMEMLNDVKHQKKADKLIMWTEQENKIMTGEHFIKEKKKGKRSNSSLQAFHICISNSQSPPLFDQQNVTDPRQHKTTYSWGRPSFKNTQELWCRNEAHMYSLYRSRQPLQACMSKSPHRPGRPVLELELAVIDLFNNLGCQNRTWWLLWLIFFIFKKTYTTYTHITSS